MVSATFVIDVGAVLLPQGAAWMGRGCLPRKETCVSYIDDSVPDRNMVLELFWTIFVIDAWSVHISLLIQISQKFSPEKAILWIKDSHFSQKQQVKTVTNMQLYSSQDVNWWTGEVWITVMFLSAVWTLILTAPIHCRAPIAEQVM